jgi:nucleoside-diphosphate-sugar epimerase
VLEGEKILVTGPAGQIAEPICRHLAQANEVWGIARFSEPGSQARIEGLGVTTRIVDLATDSLGDLPSDFSYVLHLAAYLSPGYDFDAAIRVNAEATGLLLHHCKDAKAALVMTTGGVYDPDPDPWHAYQETDPLGDSRLPAVPTYAVSKIAEEAVARTCARQFGLPTVIVRMNSAYGNNGGLPSFHLNAIAAGDEIRLRWDPNPYSLIHEDDIVGQLATLLSAATVPATIVNWGGDEPVTAQEWCAYLGVLVDREPQITVNEVPGTQRGVVVDISKRLAITGPCTVAWRDGMKAMVAARRPDLVVPGTA